MAEIEKPVPQANSSKQQSNIRRSQRPKTPSQLYADNFEDTQKLIYPSFTQPSQNGKRPHPKSAQRKNNLELTSQVEKVSNPKSDEETAIGANLESESGSDSEETEYLPFTYPPGTKLGAEGTNVKYVSFKCLVVDGMLFDLIYLRGDESNVGAGIAGSQVYSTRKIRKKPAYHDDYALTTDARKLKTKPKPVQKKTNKASSKPPKPAGNQDFLDVILSAALKAQAKQTGPDSSANVKSSEMSDDSTDHFGNNNGAPDLRKSQSTGKVSTNKFSIFDDKENMRKKLSIKKEISTRSSVNEIDINQRKADYQDHFISKVTRKEDKIVLSHTKNHPILMKYRMKKFPVKSKEMLNSKIFELPFKEEFSLSSGNNGNTDGEWKKKLKIKENIMALHFKEVLQNYKPSILI